MFSFIQSGQFSEDMIPTVGFNMRKVTKGNVTIKVRQLLAVLDVNSEELTDEVSHSQFNRCF